MNKYLKTLYSFIILISLGSILFAQVLDNNKTEYKTISNIFYYPVDVDSTDTYMSEQCRLEFYYPANKQNYATVVWFHGGGLKTGTNDIPEELKDKNIAIVSVQYRFYPKISAPKYIEDAAAATAWVFNNIKKYGGSKNKIFVSGHSAGGYLTSMIGLDKKWLDKYKIDADSIAALIPFSGHTITHFTVREERGISGEQPIIDDLAPLFHVRPNAPPLILITGDRELELLGRYEENAYMMRMMKVNGHNKTKIYELQGFDHGGMVNPAFSILLNILSNYKNEE